MARTTTTPQARAAKVRDAVESLSALLADADLRAKRHGYDHPETLLAWDAVEQAGATVHRQARLLSGKPRGG